MDEQVSAKLPGNWTSVVLLALAAVIGLLSAQSALKSSRPEETAWPKAAGRSNKAPARLWEDPFEAVLRYEQQKASDESDSSLSDNRCPIPFWQWWRHSSRVDYKNRKRGAVSVEFPRLHAHKVGASAQSLGPFLTLAVMVTGAPDVDGVEWRVRYRVATLSALAAAGYIPADSEHLEYFRSSLPNGGGGQVESVPYEWFTRSDVAPSAARGAEPQSRFENILVVWVADDWCGACPLTLLSQLRTKLQKDACRWGRNDYDNAPFRVMGPWGSTILKAMFDETTPSRKGPCANAFSGIELYVASATADDTFICAGNAEPKFPPEGSEEDTPRKRFADRCGKCEIQFRNLTCTDGQLAKELVRELGLRGVDPRKGDRLALIAEHDTLYGRTLPATFLYEVGKPPDGGDVSESLRDISGVVRCFTYLRGLDGKLAADGRQGAVEKQSPAGRDARGAGEQLDELERPKGRSQLDYIPRLAGELKRWSAERGGPLKAIGVLGSDVYDKLLLLQSLRAQFPRVIFFTTDLDARLWHPRELRWTRNLIVASSYGLQLQPDLQRGIPPFRNSYQTALFRAVLEAVEDKRALEHSDRVQDPNKPGFPAPRLFEVGYSGAYDLSVASDKQTVHPPRRPEAWYSVATHCLFWGGWGALIVLLLVVALSQFTPSPWQGTKRVAGPLGWSVFAVVLAFLIGYALVIVCNHCCDQGEPFSLLDGISIWPTELIRLAAAVLGTLFLFRSHSALSWMLTRLAKRFQLEPKPEDDLAARAVTGHSAAKNEIPASLPSQEPRIAARRRGSFSCFCSVLAIWCLRWCNSGTMSWRTETVVVGGAGKDKENIDVLKLWSHYERLRSFRSRALRCLPTTISYLVACILLMQLLGWPSQPHRGDWSAGANVVALIFGIVVFVVLTFHVLDTTWLCKRVVEILSQSPTQWPVPVLEKWRTELHTKPDYLDEWLDMRFIGGLTRVVGELIWYPVIVLVLLIVARNPCFHSFDWPLSLWLIFGLSTFFAILSAILLRGAAKSAREKELERLRFKLIAAQRERNGPRQGASGIDDSSVAQIELLIKEIEGQRNGAFAPLTSHPVVHTVLLLVIGLLASGIDIPALIEHVSGKY